MAVLAFVGFGELGSSLAQGLSNSGRHELRAYMRRPPAGDPIGERRLTGSGVRRDDELASAVSDADVVLAVVPAASASDVAQCCAPWLCPGTLYVDFASAEPERKESSAAVIAASGALYVDAAVLGTVITSGHQVPILASGPGASAWQSLATAEGLRVTALDAPAGHAALVKLIRGVYLKGRDALIVEMMLTARRNGLDRLVASSIDVPGEQVPFTAIVDRVLCSLAVHAGRRADELAAASQIVDRAGIDPAFTRAGSQTLRTIAELDLDDVIGDGRPTDASAVLAAIDRETARADAK